MKNISIYVHWPFCLSLCPYCDFNSHLSKVIDVDRWINSYKAEIDYFAYALKGKNIKSIFFGGGTPSLMDPKIVNSIINQLAKHANLGDKVEITLEANPTSFEAQKFLEFKKAGINRVSIGMQSFDDKDLKFLGRKHSAKEALQAISRAGDIFENYSFDLIYALPTQSLDDWKHQLQQAIKLSRDHISLYQLTIEKGTEFYKLFNEGKLSSIDSDIAAQMYELTNETLEKNNLHLYEISNYAKHGKECVHNLCYWNYDEYLGIGPGAHSRLRDKNRVQSVMMIHKPDKWLDTVKEKGVGIQSQEYLGDQELIEEIIMMNLRIPTGIVKADFLMKSGLNLDDCLNHDICTYYQENGLLNINDNHLKLTKKGLMLHNYIVPRILK